MFSSEDRVKAGRLESEGLRLIHVNLLKCKCGCGRNDLTRTGYVHGHKLRGFKRPQRTEIHRKRLSSSLIGVARERMTGKGNPMFGRHPHNWNPDRKQQEAKVKSRKLYHGLLGRVYRRYGTKKTQKTCDVLGYSANDLMRHLESLFLEGMTWENHGSGKGCWNVDHIRPICTFPEGTDPRIVNELSNLRPLWYEENLARTRKKWER